MGEIESKELIPAEETKNKKVFSIKEKLQSSKRAKKHKDEEKKKIKRDVVAFDIGSTNIKIAEGSYNRGKLTIEKTVTITTPKNSVEEGEIKIKDAISTMIGAALRQYNIKSKDAICTTNPTALISREIVVPKVNEEELETVVAFEIQQYLPINLDECILQSTILGEFTDEFDKREKYNVRVIVYPKRIALEYYKLLTDLNLKPYTLDVNFNALNKLVNYVGLNNEYDEKSSIALLDMGSNFIDVNIYKGKILDFTRRIKFGGNNIDNALIEEGAMDEAKAKDLKLKIIDLYDEKIDTMFENKIALNAADELIEKVEMILQFYRNKDVSNNIEKVYIFGGTSKLKGIERYMSEKLSVKTRRIDSIPNIIFRKNVYDNGHISDYLNVIGAIVRL